MAVLTVFPAKEINHKSIPLSAHIGRGFLFMFLKFSGKDYKISRIISKTNHYSMCFL